MTAREVDMFLYREALQHGATAVLWKPFDPEELKAAIQNVVKMRMRVLNKPIGGSEHTAYNPSNQTPSNEPEEKNPLTIKGKILALLTDKGIIFQDIEEIICIEADNNYTTVYRKTEKPIVVRCFLKSYERFLTEPPFFRPNRSFIVNMRFIKEIEKESRRLILKEQTSSKVIIASQIKMKLLRELGKLLSIDWA